MATLEVDLNGDGSYETQTVVSAQGSWQLTTASPLTDGQQLRLRAVDAAGNPSTVLNTQALVLTTPSLANSRGADLYGRSAPGSVVQIDLNDDGVADTQALAAVGTGVWRHTPASVLAAGLRVSVWNSDGAGHQSNTSSTLIDATAPALASLTQATTSQFAGQAPAGSFINLSLGSDTQIITVPASGAWSHTLTPALAAGTDVQVRNFDDNGTLLAEITVPADGAAPAAPTATVVDPRTLTGTAEPGAQIRLDIGANDSIDSTVTAGFDGRWSATLPSAQTNGQSVRITATDPAGQTSAPTTVTMPDSTAPQLASATPPDNGFVAFNDNLLLVFDETVRLGSSGVIRLRSLDGGTDLSFNVNDSQAGLSISGSTLTINPASDLPVNRRYAVQIDAGAIVDAAGNPFAGFDANNLTSLDFTTRLPPVQLSAVGSGTRGFTLTGALDNDWLSTAALTSVADFNGDGLDDLAVSTVGQDGDEAANNDTTRTYVLFGSSTPASLDLRDGLGSQGVLIQGDTPAMEAPAKLAAAGDINGDGLADLVIANPFGDANANNGGNIHVVFGRSSGTLALSALGAGGFMLHGNTVNGLSGVDVASPGDMNGDGLADLAIRTLNSDADAGTPGAIHLLYGQTNLAGSSIAVSDIGASRAGFVIQPEGNASATEDYALSMSAAGDVNGDGLADLLIGSPMDASQGIDAGRAYVVFGSSGTASPLALSALAAGTSPRGFMIRSAAVSDAQTGYAVNAAGDVNGDGLADLIIGAPGMDGPADRSGAAYVVWGRSQTSVVELSAISSAGNGAGLQIVAENQVNSALGISVASAGDVNHDGLADVLVGAYFKDISSRVEGRSYIVFGTTSDAPVDLASITAGDTSRGQRIDGGLDGARSGRNVAHAGDLDGDGLSDLLIGSYLADTAGRTNNGTVHALLGDARYLNGNVQQGDASAQTLTGTSGAETLLGGAGADRLISHGGADRLIGGAGDDQLVLSPGMLTALTAGFGQGGNNGQLAGVDGGGGTDTLVLSGGMALDLPTITTTPGGSRITSIERIDMLEDSAANTVTIAPMQIVHLAGMNQIHAGLDWLDGTLALAAIEPRHQLVLDGQAGDRVVLEAAEDGVVWLASGTVQHSGLAYQVFHHPEIAVQVFVRSGVTVDTPAATGAASVDLKDAPIDGAATSIPAYKLGFDVDLGTLPALPAWHLAPL